MALIRPQKINVKINPATVSYYVDKGYNIPMRYNRKNKLTYCFNEEIEVDIDDLPPKSNRIVMCTCDLCGELIKGKMNNYTLRYGNTGLPQYCKKCSIAIYHSGEKHWNWNPELTDEERENHRYYPEYKEFVKKVMERDNYTCQCCCKKIDGKGVVHHLDGYGWCIEKRTDITNGVTLCSNCHSNFHSLYGMKNNTKEQFEEWIGHKIDLQNYEGNVYHLPQVYCFEDQKIYKDYYEVANELNCHWGSVRRVCVGKSKTLYGKHFVYYEKFLGMSEAEVKDLLSYTNPSYKDDRQVICITNGKLSKSVIQSVIDNNMPDKSGIYRVLNGVCKQRKNKDGQSLQWIWHRDFIALPLSEQLSIAINNKQTLVPNSYLYNFLKENDITIN